MQQEKSSQNSPFQGYTVKELRLLARECKIKYYNKLKLDDTFTNSKKIDTNTKKNLIVSIPLNKINLAPQPIKVSIPLDIINLASTEEKKFEVPQPREPLPTQEEMKKWLEPRPKQIRKEWREVNENVKRYLERKAALSTIITEKPIS